MQRAGMTDAQVIQNLREQGYSEKDINDAINQATIKQNVEGMEIPVPHPGTVPGMAPSVMTEQYGEVPQYAEQGQGYAEQSGAEGYEYPYPETYASNEAIEEIAESIIEEKWQDFRERVGDLKGWKERLEKDLQRAEERLEKVEDSINNIQRALLEKVEDYGKGIRGLGSDVRAIEKVLSQVLDPMVANAKQLDRIIAELKTKKTRERYEKSSGVHRAHKTHKRSKK